LALWAKVVTFNVLGRMKAFGMIKLFRRYNILFCAYVATVVVYASSPFNSFFVLLLCRVEQLAGVQISDKAKAEIEANPETFVFVLPDIQKLHCKPKQMAVISIAEANCLHYEALSSKGNERKRLLNMSISKFETALASSIIGYVFLLGPYRC